MDGEGGAEGGSKVEGAAEENGDEKSWFVKKKKKFHGKYHHVCVFLKRNFPGFLPSQSDITPESIEPRP